LKVIDNDCFSVACSIRAPNGKRYDSHLYLGISTGPPKHTCLSIPNSLKLTAYNLKARSDFLPWAQQGHAVAPSGSFPVHNLHQPRALEATAVAAAAVELEAD
jgi:hypothetical protein